MSDTNETPESTGPRVEWVRDDVEDLAQRLAKQIVAKADANLEKDRREPPKSQSNSWDIRLYRSESSSGKLVWYAEVLEPMPFGIGYLIGWGASEPAALASIRWHYVQALLTSKMIKSEDDAKAHAMRASFPVVERRRD